MSVTAQRYIVDFAEDGVRLAYSGPGELCDGFDALIHRLTEEGLLLELLAHEWVRGPVPPPRPGEPTIDLLDSGSKPKRGCAHALLEIILQRRTITGRRR